MSASEVAMEEVTIPSAGETLAAWRYRASGEDFAGPAGRPCVVMAHGFAGARDCGLAPYAEAFAGAGLEVVLFDYRGFGASTGEPRGLVSHTRQRADYRAAIAWARGLDGVDSDRIVLWGTSYSGGHVVAVAAADHRIAAAIAQTPAVDGLAALLEVVKAFGVGQLLRITGHGLKDLLGSLTGRPPHTLPVVGPPGTVGFMTAPDAEPGYRAIVGPSFMDRVPARAGLAVGLNRPVAKADEVRCPLLVQVADRDSVAPVEPARRAVWKAPGYAELRTYPIGHFDIYVGEWLERAIADQLHFLRRHLGAGAGQEDRSEAA